jgi:hypothetical protein
MQQSRRLVPRLQQKTEIPDDDEGLASWIPLKLLRD